VTDPGVSREEFNAVVTGLRNEVLAATTTAGVQIGAVEKTLSEKIISTEKTLVEKISSVKLWGALALIGGQGFAAFLVKFTGGNVGEPARAALSILSNFLS
jgi:hypothetical protein